MTKRNLLKAGDKLWVKWAGRGPDVMVAPDEHEVVRVGRRFAYIKRFGIECEVDLVTLDVPNRNGRGWSSLGTAWLSLAAYEHHRDRTIAMNRLKYELTTHRLPDSVLAADIAAAALLLGIAAEKIRSTNHL